MRHFIPIVLMAILLISCNKNKCNFTIRGSVTDGTFAQSLAGAKVKLYQFSAGSTEAKLIKTGVTDTKGNYMFTFPRERVEKYQLMITKDLYFSVEEVIYFSELNIDQDYVRNSSTTAKAWAKLTFININPSNSDHLQYIKQNGKADCSDCCPKTYQDYYGDLDTSIYCINDGNSNYSYFYWVLGTSDQGIRTVYTTAFDTVEVVLNY